MVTRSVILVTASEAAAFAATTSSSSTAAAAADSVISNAPPTEQNSTEGLQTNSFNYSSCTKRAQPPFEQINLDEELQTNSFNYSSCSKPAQHRGLVQLCRHEGCFHAVDFERRNGLCCIHQKGPMDGDQSDSEDSGDDGKIRGVTGDDRLRDSDTHATQGRSYCLDDDEVGKKRALLSEDSISGKEMKKRKKVDAFTFDLTDVPPQPPVPKRAGRIKEGASKYKGVTFNKPMKKWFARIKIDGINRHIGYYDNEEAAGADYARAVFKYKGQGALDNAMEQRARDTSRVDTFVLDLTDVPPQPQIPKRAGCIKEGASKYTGVSLNKRTNKWHAQIMIGGKARFIGYYENEEEAAVDYARAVFKYKGKGALDNAREQRARDTSRVDAFTFDLTDVPTKSPIPKSVGCVKEGSSKYIGVTFNKQKNKWHAQISIDGKVRFIGYYENEEEAAVDYARAVFKYRGEFGTEGRQQLRQESSPMSV
eukprot:scaffold16684_cov79-Skeletonema_dohrnii-CCMP3373.AAC.1